MNIILLSFDTTKYIERHDIKFTSTNNEL